VPKRPRAVHAPGHTAGNAALLLERRGVLLTGDALVTRNILTGHTGPQIMPASFNRNSQQPIQSFDLLPTTAPVLLRGHGDPWTQGAAEAVRLAK
jgi:glyoxylase-like metal-dependent hydrolase (beta-lactamase superfamily II)